MNKNILILLSSLVFVFSSVCTYAQPGGGGQGPDFGEVAEKLGVTEEAFIEALGDSRPPNLAEAAEKLGITEDQLMEALPPRPNAGGQGGGQ